MDDSRKKRTDAPEDDYEPITMGRPDVPGGAVVVAAGGMVLPLAYRRMTSHRQGLVVSVQRAAMAVHAAQSDLDEAVWRARDGNVSWDVLAWSTGLSARGANKRWSE